MSLLWVVFRRLEVTIQRLRLNLAGAAGSEELAIDDFPTLFLALEGKMLDIESKASGKKGRRTRRNSQRLLQAERREVANQVMIGETDMAPTLQAHAVQVASDALDVHPATNCKDVAFYIKTEFDKEYGSGWQCITSVSFGSYVTHSSGSFINFCLGRLAIMLFKAAC